MIRHSSSTFAGVGGLSIYQQCWRPADRPRAVVAVVHGLGEHSGRYMNLVHHLVPRGFAVCGFDHRGHGRSPGRRGHINSWSEYRGDLQAFLTRLRASHGELPVFLYGHSMGAMVVLDYVLRAAEELAGVIVSGAPLTPTRASNRLLVALAKFLSWIRPTWGWDLRIEATALSRDPAVINAHARDGLVHRTASARWGTEILAAIAFVKAQPHALRQPLLMIHGEADGVNTVDGVRSFFSRVPHPDKSLRVYPGSLHEPHNDLDSAQVMEDLCSWLEKHL